MSAEHAEFGQNDDHRQFDMFGPEMQMSEKRRKRLEESWVATFYEDFSCRVDESIFASL